MASLRSPKQTPAELVDGGGVSVHEDEKDTVPPPAPESATMQTPDADAAATRAGEQSSGISTSVYLGFKDGAPAAD